MSSTLELPVARFMHTLEIVAKEGTHLSYSWNSLFNQTIDVEWVAKEHLIKSSSRDAKRRGEPEHALNTGLFHRLRRFAMTIINLFRACLAWRIAQAAPCKWKPSFLDLAG